MMVMKLKYQVLFKTIIVKFGREIPKVILIDACRGEKKLEDTKGPNDNCLVAFATQEDYKAMATQVWLILDTCGC